METEPRKKRPTFSPFRLILLLGLPFVVLALVLTAFSWTNQFRPLAVCENPFEPLLKGLPAPPASASARQPGTHDASTTISQFAQAALPWPSFAGIPAEQLADARRYQSELSAWLADCLIFNERTRALSQEEAAREVIALDKRKTDIFQKYLKVSRHFTTTEKQALYPRLEAFWSAANTRIYVDRGSWCTAALINLHDWDKVTYYLRRGGLRGRALLAVWTLNRHINKLILQHYSNDQPSAPQKAPPLKP